MPIHDWTRVIPGIFHHFHHEWISKISHALNAGMLPTGLYALAEQIAGGLGPDVLALEAQRDLNEPMEESEGGIGLLTAPPKVRFTAAAEMEHYARKRSRIAIHHASDDRVVAIIEIVSPGNKSSRLALKAFANKAVNVPLDSTYQQAFAEVPERWRRELPSPTDQK